MRFETHIDSANRIARIRITGAFDVSRFSAIVTDIMEHPDFIPGMPAVWDMREAELGHVTEQEMRSIGDQSQHLAERRGNARAALVVSDDFRFGMARMTQVLGKSPNLEMAIFRDLVSAEDWATESSEP